jgi:S-adenosylmethionine:tRNA ribosyltransferase-isomerase
MIADHRFFDLPDIFQSGDVLVFNETQVLRARLFGEFEGGKIEFLLVQPQSQSGYWRCLGRPGKKLKEGIVVNIVTGNSNSTIPNGINVRACIVGKTPGSRYLDVYFSYLNEDHQWVPADTEVLSSVGYMPIPPYIRGGNSDSQDNVDYQSVFARNPGSIAAPTASLHFSTTLCEKLRNKGLVFEFLTLHVGVASFLSLEYGDDNQVLPPAEEELDCDSSVWLRLLEYKKPGHRIIGVGTTVVRALESLYAFAPSLKDENNLRQKTGLFIQPGYKFRMIDSLITNFHQPDTTHLLLVEAFVGRAALENIYKHAISNKYRFLSYGDGMLLE